MAGGKGKTLAVVVRGVTVYVRPDWQQPDGAGNTHDQDGFAATASHPKIADFRVEPQR